MNKSKSNPNYLGIIAIILALISVASIALFALDMWERKQAVSVDEETLNESISYNGKEYVLKDDVETMLVLGLDTTDSQISNSYNNDKQADFLMLFVIDNANKTCSAIQINRDTMADIDVLGVAGDKVGTVKKQIALAHTYGNGSEVSCRNTAEAVSRVLMNVDIDHFMSVTMEAVPALNDLVGGVSVEILEDFSSIDASLVKGQTINLTGEQAMTYIRSREGMETPTHANRLVRQKQYLDALFQKGQQCSKEDKSFIAKATMKISEYMISDCTANKLESFLNKISSYTINKVEDIEGEYKQGESFMEYYPNSDAVLNLVVDAFYEEK
ncbi:MAG: LCP family protein [Clostridia bacterium]|nr:LCP family protein [Clostridia bacterium]